MYDAREIEDKYLNCRKHLRLFVDFNLTCPWTSAPKGVTGINKDTSTVSWNSQASGFLLLMEEALPMFTYSSYI